MAESDRNDYNILRENDRSVTTTVCKIWTPRAVSGTQFTLDKFAKFTKATHTHCTIPPSSNGLAEQFVQMFRRAMKTGEHDRLTLQHRLSNFLLTYCSSPHANNQPEFQLTLPQERGSYTICLMINKAW